MHQFAAFAIPKATQMRTSFTDSEDKLLVQIAYQFEREGLQVTWDYLARRMETTRSPQQLRLRLSSLKRTYGKFIRDFPKCFFGGCSARLLGAPVLPPPPPSQSSISVVMRARQRGGVNARGDVASPGKDGTVSRTSGEHCSVSGGNVNRVACDSVAEDVGHDGVRALGDLNGKGVACVDDPCQRVSTLSPRVAADVLASVFGGISARDVRQQAGRTYGNAGEVLATGVSAVLGAIGPLGHEDIFLDIGAAVGNVLAQVALMTDVRTCIGLEVRGDFLALGQNGIRQHLSNHPQLAKVEIRLADAHDVLLSRQPPFCDATVVFANIFLFEEHAKLVVLQELGAMSATRVIVSTSKFCLRHRSTCSQPYCKSWNLEHQIEVRVSWKATPHPIYIYRKNEIYSIHLSLK
ncbi:unnamed protein product [Phytophthora fragariaefolia]|uniref:Histone-lysine N-methyltransferase, H3 lysine-79 specific n=1 Tax=Phytophthora fragariaefolia TaxID=1490495 RepID=A0A9W7D8A2_9STRA|nr:unnamed protein product [Phytophthora fragariaefolia]